MSREMSNKKRESCSVGEEVALSFRKPNAICAMMVSETQFAEYLVSVGYIDPSEVLHPLMRVA